MVEKETISILGGDGNDTILMVETGSDTVNGEIGSDLIIGSTGNNFNNRWC